MAQYAIYLCGNTLCEPCQQNLHEQCSWDGCPDCDCKHCSAEHKAANLASFEAQLGTGLSD